MSSKQRGPALQVLRLFVDWRWSNTHERARMMGVERGRRCGLRTDRSRLLADKNARS